MPNTRFQVSRKGSVLYGTFVSNGSPNTFSAALLADINVFCAQIETDASILAAIVTGDGRVFCIGSDLAQIAKGLEDPHDFRAYLIEFNKTMTRFEQLPIPTVAAVNGLTRAGGLEIVLACDLTVIADDAKIGDAHSAQFAIPAGGSTQRLPRRVGIARAKELTWSGRFLSAAEAVEWGLCYAAVPAAELMARAEALVATFIDKPRPCLTEIKSLIGRSATTDLDDGVELEIYAFLNYVQNYPYVRDAIQAFKAKKSASKDRTSKSGS